MGLMGWLRGADVQPWPVPRVTPPEIKIYSIDDFRAVLTNRTLVHGPGATALLEGARASDGNSAVYACLRSLALAWTEPPPRVWQGDERGEREPVPDSPMQALLDQPNPHMDGKELQFWLAWTKHADGNAYIRKVRSGNELSGNVVQLWPLSPLTVEPVTVKGSGNFIDFYRHQLGAGRYEDIPPENILHFKLGLDDRDHRKGLAPLKRLVREVATDDEVSRFSEALIGNAGIPGLVVILPPDSNVTEEQAVALQAKLQATYGGSGRGKIGVLAPGAKMEPLGFSPEQLNLKSLHQIPETRICAVIGVPPAVAGLSVGLEQTSNYASMREVREMFTEGTLLPLWTMAGARWTAGLRDDFTSDRRVFIAYDTGEVRALQEDMDKRYARLDTAVQGGWVTPNEARAEVGFAPLPELERQPAASDDAEPALRVVKMLLERKAINLEALPEVYAAMIDLAAPSFTTDLEAYFDRQRRTVKRRLVSGG